MQASNTCNEVITRPHPPDLDGYLAKLKHKKSLFGDWTERYFRVNTDLELLEYFHGKPKDTEALPAGSIDLNAITAVKKFDGYSFQIEGGHRNYFLRASSAADQACWVNGLQTYHEQRKEYERHLRKIEIEQKELEQVER